MERRKQPGAADTSRTSQHSVFVIEVVSQSGLDQRKVQSNQIGHVGGRGRVQSESQRRALGGLSPTLGMASSTFDLPSVVGECSDLHDSHVFDRVAGTRERSIASKMAADRCSLQGVSAHRELVTEPGPAHGHESPIAGQESVEQSCLRRQFQLRKGLLTLLRGVRRSGRPRAEPIAAPTSRKAEACVRQDEGRSTKGCLHVLGVDGPEGAERLGCERVAESVALERPARCRDARGGLAERLQLGSVRAPLPSGLPVRAALGP